MIKMLKGLKDTKKLAEVLAARWIKKRGPVIAALYGDLGSGKTTFVQFFARALGIEEKVLSPTFLIIKSFALPQRIGRFKSLIHIDAYRLKSAKDLLALDLKDILKDKENIVVIEWPEKVERYLPIGTKETRFEVVGKDARKVVVSEKHKAQN